MCVCVWIYLSLGGNIQNNKDLKLLEKFLLTQLQWAWIAMLKSSSWQLLNFLNTQLWTVPLDHPQHPEYMDPPDEDVPQADQQVKENPRSLTVSAPVESHEKKR